MKLKPHLLFWTNVLNGLLFLALAGTGALLHFGPPAALATHGRGKGWFLFGYHKHDYQELHFWIAALMLVGVAVHMVMHSNYVKTATLKHLGVTSLVKWLMTDPVSHRRRALRA
jgi:hypothetical protein